MPASIERIVIGYGSESGNAHGLVERLARLPGVQPYAVVVQDLNSLSLDSLTRRDRLVIVSSSFGDGEPPGNADRFLDQVAACATLEGVPYALFGLGDTAYPTFCGFTKAVDAALLEKKAIPFMNRVDADIDFDGFFDTWCAAFEAVLKGDAEAGLRLDLQVTAYGENAAWPARILSRIELNATAPYAYQLRLDLKGSGIKYRAGDNLYVLAENDPALLARIDAWFGLSAPSDLLRHKELRQIGKSTLRDLAKASQNDSLKDLLKVSARKDLDGYLYGKDLFDVLTDFCAPEQFSLQELAEWLPERLPRAYSIASHDHADYVDLCIREVAYSLEGRDRTGMATGYLTRDTQAVQVFVRSNPRFHLARDAQHPLLLIGTGTGIAPLIALLEQRERENSSARTCLVFGDRRRASDYLYRPRLAGWHARGVLERVLTAFSRDSDRRYYVQDALVDNGAYIWELIEQGAHLYLCGNKANLESAIEQALVTVASQHGKLDDEAAEAFVQALVSTGRVHKELY